ncbi:hypothetical protein CAEBREN_05998 [Caenorhabditis brenneri]|uniref:One cut domain family member n=1 Tax=Caenorhabditis brenneri TaxID=135651 RepID=G0NC37_CAEBE|nr:hypothetical protein CAEBREN_05998 [Caenorhabditis brenneri]
MPYHCESTFNAINGHHFENLNLEGLVNYVDAADLSIDNNGYGEFDDQYGTIQNELAQEPAVFHDYDFDNRTEIIYQQQYQQQFDYEAVQVQQDYQGEVIDCVEAPVGIAGGYMAGNENYHAGIDQFIGNHGHFYAAPHHHLQNHQQFGWSVEAVGTHLTQEHILPTEPNHFYGAVENQENVDPVQLPTMPNQFYETHQVENQENMDPMASGVPAQNLQFAMPQYSVGVDYEQRSPQKLVEEKQPEVMLEAEVIALDSVLANQWLDEKVEYIDTKEMMGRLKEWMTKTGNLQKNFAEKILNLSQSSLSTMISSPKTFGNLKRGGKKQYYRMFNFLKFDEQIQNAFFQLKLFSSPKPKRATGANKKTNFTPQQRACLFAYFRMIEKPSDEDKEEIARVVGVPPHSVHHFYKNNKKSK